MIESIMWNLRIDRDRYACKYVINFIGEHLSAFPKFQQTRAFANIYSPLIQRNRVPYINFETGSCRPEMREPSLTAAFTMSKQRKLQALLRRVPVTPFNGRVIRQLSAIKIRMAGRNDRGRRVVRHQGGGHRQRIRFIDFKRARKDMYARVLRIEYCPGRYSQLIVNNSSDCDVYDRYFYSTCISRNTNT